MKTKMCTCKTSLFGAEVISTDGDKQILSVNLLSYFVEHIFLFSLNKGDGLLSSWHSLDLDCPPKDVG